MNIRSDVSIETTNSINYCKFRELTPGYYFPELCRVESCLISILFFVVA